jgi:hypothetical protein
MDHARPHQRPLTGTAAQLEPLNRDDIARADDPKQRHGDGRPQLVRRGKIKEWLQTRTTTQSETIDRGDDGWDGRSPVNSRCRRLCKLTDAPLNVILGKVNSNRAHLGSIGLAGSRKWQSYPPPQMARSNWYSSAWFRSTGYCKIPRKL